MRPERPISDSCLVRPGRLLAGEYPRDKDDASSPAKLCRLLEAGVTFLLDLTERGEHGLKPYVPLLQQKATRLSRQVVHRRIPIPDCGTPTRATMIQILDELNTAQGKCRRNWTRCGTHDHGNCGATGDQNYERKMDEKILLGARV